MATTGTYTWTGANGGNWNTASNWTGAGASWTDSGSGSNGLLLVLGAGSGSYVVNVPIVVSAGAVDITSSNVTVDITGTLRALAAAANTGAGGTFTMNGGTVDLAGGHLTYYQMSIEGGATIIGNGTIADPAYNNGTPFLDTSGANSAIIASGGLLNIVGVGSGNEVLSTSGSFDINTGATLEFGSNADLTSGSINFQGDAGTLSIYNGSNDYTVSGGVQNFDGTLSTMEVGTTGGSSSGASVIDFQGLTITAADYSGNVSAGTLDVVAGGVTYQFDTTQTTPSHVNWASDGNGGTDVWLDTHPCYAEGTRILTGRGEVAVEQLAEGDMIVTLSGGTTSLRPVRWIGQRRINVRQHPQPNLVAPIRVRQHAFGQNLPTRDLMVSPDHCLFVDGKLIPAKLLINAMTIVQQRDVAAVHYYHVELDQHSVMFAEGLPAESYLDTGNRAMFSNAGLALVMHPDFAINAHLKCWETDACAPLAVDQDIVKPIWDSLVERAESLGYQRAEVLAATTTDPELRLVADGRVLRPLSSDEGRYVFMLPAGVSSVRLTSRSSVPSDFAAYLDDWRTLGVAVRRIVVRDSSGLTEIPPDHPGLTQGWYRSERDASTMWRWTNGDAVLPIGHTAGPAMLEVHASPAAKYILEEDAQGRLAA